MSRAKFGLVWDCFWGGFAGFWHILRLGCEIWGWGLLPGVGLGHFCPFLGCEGEIGTEGPKGGEIPVDFGAEEF